MIYLFSRGLCEEIMGFSTVTALFYFYFILQLHLEIRKFEFGNKRGRERETAERGGKKEKGRIGAGWTGHVQPWSFHQNYWHVKDKCCITACFWSLLQSAEGWTTQHLPVIVPPTQEHLQQMNAYGLLSLLQTLIYAKRIVWDLPGTSVPTL